MIKLLTCTILITFLTSCTPGSDCPIDPPECCTNALFGCGTFDLPENCSCSDYTGL